MGLASVLEDGAIAGDEYRLAESAFLDCLSTAGVEFSPPQLVAADTEDARKTWACYDAELRAVDQARLTEAAASRALSSETISALANREELVTAGELRADQLEALSEITSAISEE